MYRTITTEVYHDQIEDYKIFIGVLCSKINKRYRELTNTVILIGRKHQICPQTINVHVPSKIHVS